MHQLGIITPKIDVGETEWPDLLDLQLADPNYRQKARVDLLIGADLYSTLLRKGLHRSPSGALVAQNTSLGWVISGVSVPLTSGSPNTDTPDLVSTCEASFCEAELSNDLLRRFWELEDFPPMAHLSKDDGRCEKIFSETFRRSDEGRYTVRLPLKSGSRKLLGNTLKRAQNQMSRLRQRLSEDLKLRKEYETFLRDYEQSGHMRRISTSSSDSPGMSSYYLPHHGVWQKADDRDKLRVVFNASAQSTTGISLNDVLLTGPSLQRDLMSIILRWMFHPIVFCTDIGQMYRQIRIHEQDVDLQRIVWQSEEDSSAHHFELLTVTYGMSCAPYLAIRTLRQLAEDEGRRFRLAREALLSDTYVDDIVTGADDVSSAITLRDQLVHLLKLGGFPLGKWVSNHPDILNGIPNDNLLRPNWKDFSEGPAHALGISWDPVSDHMRFTTPNIGSSNNPTKRRVLSIIARLFDPVGWLSPFVIRGKILLQELWRQGVEWDQSLPQNLVTCWEGFLQDLRYIANIQIPRWVGTKSHDHVQIHAFADASQHAYAAVVYVRTSHGHGSSRLLASKTRVAPLKTIAIPRLELCAATLLVQLTKKVIEDLNRNITAVHA